MRRGVAALVLVGWLGVLGACTRRAAVAPEPDPWAEFTDVEMARRITAARARAAAEGKWVLLEFVAPWCADCREMTRIEGESPAREVLAARYVRVRVNVGAWDRHRALVQAHGIDRIAAYVVLEPRSGVARARTTVEPVSGHQPMTPARWAAWLRAPRDTL